MPIFIVAVDEGQVPQLPCRVALCGVVVCARVWVSRVAWGSHVCVCAKAESPTGRPRRRMAAELQHGWQGDS